MPKSASRVHDEELVARDIHVHFEGVRAVDGIDMGLRRAEVLGLIGPNGAGKTTLVNAVSGFQRLTHGRVSVFGTDVTGWPAHRLARIGLGRTFQDVRLFPELTVLENVEVGGVGVGLSRREARRRAWDLLEEMALPHIASWPAAALPQGEERRIGILRALAMNPYFVLLDEPAAGLNESEADELMAAITGIRDQFGCGILVIEHDMRFIMKLCERIQVLDHGKTISIGTPAEVQKDDAVITAYLGTKGRMSVDRP